MRPQYLNRDPRLNRSPVMTGVAVLLATIVTGTAACSGDTPAAVTPAVKASSRVAPSSPPTRDAVVPPAPSVVGAAHLARSVPVRLQIPAIGVDSALMDLGLRDDGSMEVPPGAFPAGWFTGAPTPGELGPAIIAGHVDMKGPGVFAELRDTKRGDKVTITRKDGSRPVFRVARVERFPKDQFPTSLVYGNISHAGLRLITCGGSFNKATGHYDDNYVVFAELVAPAR